MVDDESAEDRFDFAKFMQLDVSDIERQMHDAAALTVNQIRVEAAQADMSPESRREYLAGVSVAEVSSSGFVIELRGMLANLLEQGFGAGGIGTYTGSLFDMRPFILKPGTRNLRHTKDGAMYVNVPFKHALGDIAKMGGAMATAAAKALAPTRTDPSGSRPTQWGGRLGAGFGPQKPHWVTDALHGLVRHDTTYSRAVQSTFQTWRRITELGHGNDAAWWSKGTEPRAIFDKVVAKLDGILAMVGL